MLSQDKKTGTLVGAALLLGAILALVGLLKGLSSFDENQLLAVAITGASVAVLFVCVRRAGSKASLGWYSVLVYLVLFAPLVVVILFAFNSGDSTTLFSGFATRWFAIAWDNAAIRQSIFLSLQIATAAAFVSMIMGTAAALVLGRLRPLARTPYETTLFLTLVIPELMIAIGLLLFFTRFDFVLGPTAMLVGHATVGTSLVTLIVRARHSGMGKDLEIASADLGAGPTATLVQVSLPRLAPAMAAGALLAFTMSFDDVVISQFVSGSTSQTWPLYVYSSLRFGVKPDVNATASVMIAITLLTLATAYLVVRRVRIREGTPT